MQLVLTGPVVVALVVDVEDIVLDVEEVVVDVVDRLLEVDDTDAELELEELLEVLEEPDVLEDRLGPTQVLD